MPNKKQNKTKIKAIVGTIVPLTVIPAIIAPLATSCSCSEVVYVELSKEVTDKGISLKSANVKKDQESTFELNLPQGTSIVDVELTIGDITATKGDHLAFDGGIVWVDSYWMVANKIYVKSVTLSSDRIVDGLICEAKGEFGVASTITSKDVSVKLKYKDKSVSEDLVWSKDYVIYKDGSKIDNFDTVGYTFTLEDAKQGKVDFEVEYIKTSLKQTMSVILIQTGVTQEIFLKVYEYIYSIFNTTPLAYKALNVEAATFQGQEFKTATIEYALPSGSKHAVATFDTATPSTAVMGGALLSEVTDHLNSFDTDTYSKTFTIHSDSISWKIALKSDETKYEEITFNKYTYKTLWKNTFDEAKVTDIKDIEYIEMDILEGREYTTVREDECMVYATTYGTWFTGTIIVPEKLMCNGKLKTVTGIKARGFSHCSCVEVIFEKPDNITEIQGAVFTGSLIQQFTVPKNVKKIPSKAFQYTYYLKTLTFENTTGWKQINGDAINVDNPETNAININNCETGENNWGATGIIRN